MDNVWSMLIRGLRPALELLKALANLRRVRMPFSPPLLPEVCDILNGVALTVRHAAVPCAVRCLDRNHNRVDATVVSVADLGITIIFPPKTDVRDSTEGGVQGPDLIEMPPGSGSRYIVRSVGDQYRAFPNEYRVACVTKTGFLGPRP